MRFLSNRTAPTEAGFLPGLVRGLLLGFALLAGARPGSAQTLGEATRPLADAHAAYQAGDLPRAEALVRGYLAGHPDSANAMYLLARVLEQQNKPRESLDWFTRGARALAPSGEDLRVVSLDYVLLSDYTDAVTWLNKSVQLDPANAEAWYDLGRARMMQQDFHGARQPLEKALALRPRFSKAENNLGVVDEAENRAVEAEAAYRLAIEWQKSDARPSEQPLLNLGTLLVAQQKSAEALPLLKQAVALAPRDPKCREQLARALEQQGEQAGAVSTMEAAVGLDPRNPRLHYELGQLYRRAGLGDKARQELALSQQLYGEHSAGPDN